MKLAAVLLIGLGISSDLSGQIRSTPNGDWRYYNADITGSKYSPLDLINAGNFSKLEVAWRFRTDNMGPALDYRLGATPIMADGVVYVVGGGMRRFTACGSRIAGKGSFYRSIPRPPRPRSIEIFP